MKRKELGFLFRRTKLFTLAHKRNTGESKCVHVCVHTHTQSCSLQQWNHCVKSLSYRGGGDIPSSGCLSPQSRSNQSKGNLPFAVKYPKILFNLQGHLYANAKVTAAKAFDAAVCCLVICPYIKQEKKKIEIEIDRKEKMVAEREKGDIPLGECHR